MKSSVARRFNDTTSTITTAKPDFATRKWNAKVDSLWPWKEEILNEYREKVDASKFYPISGPEQSPYGSNGATRLIIQMHSVFNKISEMATENKITIEE
uniref:Uncharacterized protein n=1 Tax=Panagrolaimus davidi TaxID=227884 RepID=A0A914R8Z3_9BILA